MAIASGTYDSFRKHKERKTILLHVLAFGTLSGVLLLIPILAAVFGITQFAASTCGAVDIPLAVLDTHPPDFSMLAKQAAPAVAVVQAIAKGVVDDNVTVGTELAVDETTLTTALAVDISPLCSSGGKIPFVCDDFLYSVSLLLATTPFVSAKPQSAYFQELQPVCAAVEEFVASIETACASEASYFSVAPGNAKSAAIEALITCFMTLDSFVTYVFGDSSVGWLFERVLDVNMTTLTTLANSLDEIDYAAFYTTGCADVQELNFWALVMLVGGLVHLPAAMVAWHLLWRYSTIMKTQDGLVLNGDASGAGVASPGRRASKAPL